MTNTAPAADPAQAIALRIDDVMAEQRRYPEGHRAHKQAQRVLDVLLVRFHAVERGEADIVPTGCIGYGTRSHYLVRGDWPVCGTGGTDPRFGAPVLRVVDRSGEPATCRTCRAYADVAHS
jgi:hypothetical protein